MATGKQQTIPAATATKVADNPLSDSTQAVLLTNSTGAVLYVGGANVSNTVYGAQIAAAGTLTVTVASEDDLWVYSVAGGNVGVLSSP